GRFLQTDPIRNKDDFNLYTYVGNDPLDRTDPSGNEGVLNAIADALDVADREFFTPLGPMGGMEEHLLEVPIVAGLRAAAGVASVETKSVRAAQLAKNVEQGAKGEVAAAEKLGDKVAGKQVTFKTSDGTRTRADIVTKDKGVVEVKTGNSPLTKGQQKLQDDIKAGREVTPVGGNAGNAGLTPGQPTKMTSCTVDRICTP
ncbi:MAG: RHS repeat-associated core domain-containing protein, partial [Pseudomonadota bacterium]